MVNGLLALSSHEEGYSWQQPKIGNPQPADHALFDRGVCLFFSSGPGSLATMTGEVRAGHGLPGSARHAVLRTAPPLKRPPPPSGLLVGDLHRCREPPPTDYRPRPGSPELPAPTRTSAPPSPADSAARPRSSSRRHAPGPGRPAARRTFAVAGRRPCNRPLAYPPRSIDRAGDQRPGLLLRQLRDPPEQHSLACGGNRTSSAPSGLFGGKIVGDERGNAMPGTRSPAHISVRVPETGNWGGLCPDDAAGFTEKPCTEVLPDREGAEIPGKRMMIPRGGCGAHRYRARHSSPPADHP